MKKAEDFIINFDVVKSMNRMGVVTEENVDEYIKLAKNLFKKNTKKPKKTLIPDEFDTKAEKDAWELEEVIKCIHGDENNTSFGMNGKMYFWLNYYNIKTYKGWDTPEYRVVNHALFELLHDTSMYAEPNELQYLVLLVLKRRRIGFSTTGGCDMLHECIFHPSSEVAGLSKTEEDGVIFLKKARQAWDKLPFFLKHPMDGQDTKQVMEFYRKSEDKYGNTKISGNESILNSTAPVPTRLEGRMLHKLYIDEVGKIEHGEELWHMTEDALKEAGKLKGQATLGGTAGDVDKGGKAIKNFWNNYDEFVKFFIPAWAGIQVDEHGNDINIEEQVRSIMKERARKLKKGGKEYFFYLQKQPLTPQESLLSNKVSGIGNIGEITNRIDALKRDYKDPIKKGYFEWDKSGNGKAIFIPSPTGKVYIYEDYDPHYKYASGIDTVDHDGVGSGLSDQAMYIMRHDFRSSNARLACRYVDRTEKVEDYYEQALLASIYYGDHKPLVENNRVGFIKWFDYNGFIGKLKKEPLPANTVMRKYTPKIGARKNSNSENEFRELADKYTRKEYIEGVDDIELLEELLDYGEKNTDKAVAYLWALVSMEDDLTRRTNENKKEKKKDGFKKLSFRKDRHGRIVRNR
jgi:hypothetical protein